MKTSFLIYIQLFCVLMMIVSCSQELKEETNQMTAVRENQNKEYYSNLRLYHILKTKRDTLIYKSIRDYSSFIDGQIKSSNSSHFMNMKKLDSLFLIPEYFKMNDMSLVEHIFLEKELMNQSLNLYGHKRISSFDEVSVFGAEKEYIFRQGEKDSILVGLKFIDSYLTFRNTYSLSDSLIEENGFEFYLKVNTNETGDFVIPGQISFKNSFGQTERLDYNVSVKVR